MLSPDISFEDKQVARDVLIAMHGYEYSDNKILLLYSKKVHLENKWSRTYECKFDLDIYKQGDIISSYNNNVNFGISRCLGNIGTGSGLYIVHLLDDINEWILHKTLRPGTIFRKVLNYSFDAEGI